MDPSINTPIDSRTARDGVRRLIEYDDARASAPYEHAFTLAAGLGLALCALRTERRSTAVCHAMLAGALLFRAAAGRDGLRGAFAVPSDQAKRDAAELAREFERQNDA